MEELYYFYLFPLQFARFSGMLIAVLWNGVQRPVLGEAVPVENKGRRLHHEEIAGFADGGRRDVPAGDTGFRGHRRDGGDHRPD